MSAARAARAADADGARSRATPALICVRVTPRGGRDAVIGWDGDTLRVRVAAAPSDGAANRAVIELLARHFGVAKRDIELVRGESSREKWVRVGGLDVAALQARAASD